MAQRILVVDDDVRVHELIRWALRTPRYEVHAFSEPQHAIVRALDIRPHLIICDMMMPSMDGQVFLRLVKQASDLKDVPFLFLTGVRLGSDVQAALKAGADAYLVKPFPLAKLVEIVEKVLSDVALRSASAPPDLAEDSVDEAPSSLETLLEAAAPVFEGRSSTLDLGIGRVHVQTQTSSRQGFVITTVLSLEGEKGHLKRIEAVWRHASNRDADHELVKRQIDLQHDRAVEDAQHEPLFGAHRDAVEQADSVEPKRR